MTDISKFVNFMLELSSSAHEIFCNYFHSKQPRNHDTLQISSVLYLAITPRSRHVLHSVRKVCVCVGGGGRYHSLMIWIWRDAAKIRGEMPCLNNFKSI
jgi:hypothetical protein